VCARVLVSLSMCVILYVKSWKCTDFMRGHLVSSLPACVRARKPCNVCGAKLRKPCSVCGAKVSNTQELRTSLI
jgi:hypothetical protein